MTLLIHKFYSANSRLTAKKKIIVMATGANALNDIQYELIQKQFDAICNYLHWEYDAFMPVSAYNPEDICMQNETIERIKNLASSL